MRIGITTYGFMYVASLASSLESIARAGFKLVEIAPAPPHLLLAEHDLEKRKRLVRRFDHLGLSCVSVNPPELNLISANPDLREVALRYYRASVILAHELGARIVVVIPGRQSQLIPMPRDTAVKLALTQLSQLAKLAHRLRVDLAVEAVPLGFAESAAEVAALVRDIGDERVGMALDVANIFGREDVGRAVEVAAPSLKIAHLSDTWRNRWAHTAIGTADVDFAEFVGALERIGFKGPCIYELVDGMDPRPHLAADVARLRALGLET
jgi:sugar phosphate isomerase/epimerase